jgi:hypothetical protein
MMQDDIEVSMLFTLTPEERATFQGRGVLMVTPIQEAEKETLRRLYLEQLDFLQRACRSLATLKEIQKADGASETAMQRTGQLLDGMSFAVLQHDSMLQILGRSKFVGGDEYGPVTEGTVQ